MKFERIDDSKFNCFVSRAELQQLNIELSDLTYGSGLAKRFFYDILKRAQEEIDFEPAEVPLIIEAIPTNEDGLLIQFSYVEDADELDSRFAYFAPYIHDGKGEYYDEDTTPAPAPATGADDILKRLNKKKKTAALPPTKPSDEMPADFAEVTENPQENAPATELPETPPKIQGGLSVFVNGKNVKDIPNSAKILKDIFSNLFGSESTNAGSPLQSLLQRIQGSSEDSGQEKNADATEADELCILFAYRSFDELCKACAMVMPYSGKSKLFLPSGTSEYLLALYSSRIKPDTFNRICNIMSEYGEMIPDASELLVLRMEEYDECIIAENAVEHLAKFC